MTTGAQDKKKLGLLILLGLVAVYLVYTNLLAGPDVPRDTAQSSTPAAPAATPVAATTGQTPVRAPASRARSEEFHPVLHSKRPEDHVDPLSIDPTLRLDLFTKVQSVELTGGSRNLFQFSTAPPPKPVELAKGKEPKILPKEMAAALAAKPAGPPQPPPPPPIALKFYGFSTIRDNGKKTAYFLDGDEILSASEGDLVKRRYKVLKIGPTSVLMEDTDGKRQQSLPLVEEAQS